MLRIRGIVSFYNHVRERIAHPMTSRERRELLKAIERNVRRIEELCEEHGIRPDDLPARSRTAYWRLKSFDGSQIVIGTSGRGRKDGVSAREHEELSRLFRSVYRKLFGKGRPKIHAEYYPYSSLKSTVRVRNDAILVRVTDALRHAPADVKRALAAILLSRLEGAACPQEQRKIYMDYIGSPEVREAARRLRQLRGIKPVRGPEGDVHNLKESFRRVNDRYFGGKLPMPEIAWSERRTRSVLGHEDEAMNAIVISRSLDSRSVPKYVLDYVMYHELLHLKHGSEYSGGRRRLHTRAFREDERRFVQFRKAKEWLSEHRP
ncbi:MAG: hypothetical protein ACE5QF_04520 [Thermoplasmata archaeon]